MFEILANKLNLTLKNNYKYYFVIDTYENKAYSITKPNFFYYTKYKSVAYRIIKYNRKDIIESVATIKFKIVIGFDKISDFINVFNDVDSKFLKKLIKMVEPEDELYDKLFYNLEEIL